MNFTGNLPQWAQYLIDGLVIFAMMASSAIVLTRAGRSPWWSLLMLLPHNLVIILLFWVFAFTPWPRLDDRKTAG